MKKLITDYNGGMPDLLDNIRWLEAGLKESIGAIGKSLSFNHDAIKLFGAEIEMGPTYVNVSSGAIYFNDEVFLVPEHQINKAPTGHVYFWEIRESFDPAGFLNFQNGEQYNVYLNREVKLNSGESIPTGALNFDIPSLFDLIQPAPNVGLITLLGDWQHGYVAPFVKLENGLVSFHGTVWTIVNNYDAVDLLIPVEFAPDQTKVIECIGTLSGQMEPIKVKIDPSGDVRVLAPDDLHNSVFLWLDSVKYHKYSAPI